MVFSHSVESICSTHAYRRTHRWQCFSYNKMFCINYIDVDHHSCMTVAEQKSTDKCFVYNCSPDALDHAIFGCTCAAHRLINWPECFARARDKKVMDLWKQPATYLLMLIFFFSCSRYWPFEFLQIKWIWDSVIRWLRTNARELEFCNEISIFNWKFIQSAAPTVHQCRWNRTSVVLFDCYISFVLNVNGLNTRNTSRNFLTIIYLN